MIAQEKQVSYDFKGVTAVRTSEAKRGCVKKTKSD